eukprot:22954-Amphidinium_carterae.1
MASQSSSRTCCISRSVQGRVVEVCAAFGAPKFGVLLFKVFRKIATAVEATLPKCTSAGSWDEGLTRADQCSNPRTHQEQYATSHAALRGANVPECCLRVSGWKRVCCNPYSR